MSTLSTWQYKKAALPNPMPLTTLALLDGQWESPYSFLFCNLNGTSYFESYTSQVRIMFYDSYKILVKSQGVICLLSLYDTQSFSWVAPNKQVVTEAEKPEYPVKKQLSPRGI